MVVDRRTERQKDRKTDRQTDKVSFRGASLLNSGSKTALYKKELNKFGLSATSTELTSV